MTEQERQLIQSLATRIQNAPSPQIDREADELIRAGITRPDALYLLVQTVLIQDMALNQAKAQIDELKQRAAAPSGATSSGFLPNEQPPRSASPGNWGQENRVQQPAPQAQYGGGGYQQPPAPPQQVPSGGGFGSFLRTAATTAAGVIAGETAFSALSSMVGHHAGYAGGSGFLGGAPLSPGSETIINNYYDDDRDRGEERGLSAGNDMRNIDDQGDFDDRNDNSSTADDQSYDDQADAVDDSSFDDNSDDDGSVDV